MVKENVDTKTAKINSEENDAASDNDSKDTDSNIKSVKRVRGRKSAKPSTNAARERSRVQNLKQAFLELQKALPNVPSGTKLSKLDILLLATNYISHLMSKLSNGHLKEHLSRLKDTGTLHPIKKWPMRSRLYVSDPMWLYRSGRQNAGLSQSFDSSSSGSMISSEEEENSPALDTADIPSPISASVGNQHAMMTRCRSSCRANPYYNGASQIDLSCSYGGGAMNPCLTQYQDINFQSISCVFQNIIPDIQSDNQ